MFDLSNNKEREREREKPSHTSAKYIAIIIPDTINMSVRVEQREGEKSISHIFFSLHFSLKSTEI